MDDGLVVSVDIQGNFVSGKQVSQTQSALVQVHVLDLFALQKLQKVSSESSQKFVDDCRSGGLNFEGFIDSAGELIVTDSQFNFGFFFHGELFAEEIDKDFGGFA